MEDASLPVLLITANVGSIFEDPERCEATWASKVLETLAKFKPKFVAIHFQECGGKTSGQGALEKVEHFASGFLGRQEISSQFDRICGWFDQDYGTAAQYTALGSVYLVHKSLNDVSLWNYKDGRFSLLDNEHGMQVHVGDLNTVDFLKKTKFPQDFFPRCKWSRKGFMRTRWKIKDRTFELVNIHLFHDDSNLEAMRVSPSVYTGFRKRALDYTLQNLQDNGLPNVPFFIFGDFNFRLDAKKVVEFLCTGMLQQHVRKDGENSTVSKIIYKDRNGADKVFLTIEDRIFHLIDQSPFKDENGQKFYQFNKEFDLYRDQLSELKIAFPPSYSFCEDSNKGTEYGNNRCPAWCDRILLSHSAKKMLKEGKTSTPEYDLIGHEVCMGDHKPVYLCFPLDASASGKGKTRVSDNGKMIPTVLSLISTPKRLFPIVDGVDLL